MAYIGKQPLVGNYISCDSLSASATTTYNLASSGTPVFPTVPQNCIVSLNGVVQAPVTSFTISGSAIVFSTTLSTTDSIDYITVLGNTLNIGTPSNNTVGLSQLSATGAPSTGTFLRGDNSWAAAGLAWPSVQTTGFTAVKGNAYPCNTTSAAFTVTLPASPSVGDQVLLLDYAGTFATNNITLGRNSNNIEGSAVNKILTTNREAVTLTYVDSTQGWVSTSASNYGTQSIDPIVYSVDFLVIAGGGGGGEDNHTPFRGGGGGGAGGYRTSTQSVNAGTVITVTVGDGGVAGGAHPNSQGTSGSNSSISGSGLTTITSTGGGAGGAHPPAGLGGQIAPLTGGSGGGGSNGFPGAAGNTPSTSPSQGNAGGDGGGAPYSGAGGGGAGAVGQNEQGSTGGAGGSGTASSITGSSVTRAGGGGGNGYTTGGAGGNGGGGAGGSSDPGAGVAGTANTGGGGGGASNGAGAGGKGVVILSVPTARYSSTSTGSPTVTTSGSNTILQFNGSGSYTA